MKKKLPIGIQTFREIIENHYCYVDKTGIAVDLIEHFVPPKAFWKKSFSGYIA